jgi:hypothetical protein
MAYKVNDTVSYKLGPRKLSYIGLIVGVCDESLTITPLMLSNVRGNTVFTDGIHIVVLLDSTKHHVISHGDILGSILVLLESYLELGVVTYYRGMSSVYMIQATETLDITPFRFPTLEPLSGPPYSILRAPLPLETYQDRILVIQTLHNKLANSRGSSNIDLTVHVKPGIIELILARYPPNGPTTTVTTTSAHPSVLVFHGGVFMDRKALREEILEVLSLEPLSLFEDIFCPNATWVC